MQALHHKLKVLGVALLAMTLSGCTAILSPISGVPAHRLPDEFHAKPKNNLVPIDVSRLKQDPAEDYYLDERDVLGIYVENVLGQADQPPPFTIPDSSSDLPPALGYPIPVRGDGTISLPLIDPISVRGLTIADVETKIRHAYTIDQRILQPGSDRIIVSLMRPREYSVLVLRQDGVQKGIGGSEGGAFVRTNGQVIKLEAYSNDVLTALTETGGLPGPEAKNEVLILKADMANAEQRDEFIKHFYSCEPGDCLCLPPLPDDPAVVRIPLRLPPGELPTFDKEDILLESGDIVLLPGRETEVFYTAGLLGGGEHPLPRDYDLDVITALATVGGAQVYGGGASTGGSGGIGIGSIGGVPPSQLFILRKTTCDDQIIIAVDINRAIRDPDARPLVQAGDTLVLQYKPIEEIVNFGLGTFFSFGFSSRNR